MRKRRDLKLRVAKFMVWDGELFKKALDGTFLRCIDKQQQTKLLNTFHDEACRGHFSSLVMAFKILRQGYCWPRMFKDAYS